MNRDEILQKSRQENAGRDEMERDSQAQASRVAVAVGGILCAAIILLEALLGDHVNVSTWAVFLSMTGTMLLVKYFRMRKTHELVFALIEIALAVVFLVMYVMQLAR